MLMYLSLIQSNQIDEGGTQFLRKHHGRTWIQKETECCFQLRILYPSRVVWCLSSRRAHILTPPPDGRKAGSQPLVDFEYMFLLLLLVS